MAMPEPDRRTIDRKDDIVAALKTVVPGAVISQPSETRAYECDALTAYRCPPLAVVLPRSTAEMAAAMAVCHKMGVKVIPRGAGTSLAGGSLPTADSVVLGTARLNAVLEVNPGDRYVRVEAGITNLAVTGAVQEEGFFYAPDPSSQLACAISGNIAMNSGGAHCLKYGVTTNNLLGVTMVLADGEVIQLGGPHADAEGYDLLGVICGSEGQFGIVTEAVLRILPKPEGARPVLIGFDAPETAGECVAGIIRSGVLPVAIEYMDRLCISAVKAFSGADYPDVDALLIVEVEGSPAEIEEQLEKVLKIAEGFNPVVLREARDTDEAAKIWVGRKSAFGAMGRINDYMCLDGTVPVSALSEVLKRTAALSEKHGLQCANVFHAGDGNMHPLILFDANTPGDLERAEAFGADILKVCVEVGGCLSGEHGVGIEKRDLMTAQFSAVDMSAQMKVKDCFDPKWLLNPAKVFPLDVSEAHRAS
ncbi:MAG: FAD-linked oxidase C-terminal domain-containing protein [Pseudomonadota bacterium]